MRILPSNLSEIFPTFRWSAATQRRFVETLAESGSVRVAAASVSKTHRAAYQLRKRADGRWFAVGWDAAILRARDLMEGRMMEAAFAPVEYEGVRLPGSARRSWRRTDPALARGRGMALLHRLDKAAAKIIADVARNGLARLALAEWDDFLELLGRDTEEAEWQGFWDALRELENDVLCGYLHPNLRASAPPPIPEVPNLVADAPRLGFVPCFGPAAGTGLEV